MIFWLFFECIFQLVFFQHCRNHKFHTLFLFLFIFWQNFLDFWFCLAAQECSSGAFSAVECFLCLFACNFGTWPHLSLHFVRFSLRLRLQSLAFTWQFPTCHRRDTELSLLSKWERVAQSCLSEPLISVDVILELLYYRFVVILWMYNCFVVIVLSWQCTPSWTYAWIIALLC